MAVTDHERDVQILAPAWPDVASLIAERIRFTYDRPSDTLFVDFFGDARPAASDPLDLGDRDYFYLRVDVATDEVVGLQIEQFLSYAVVQHPELVDALVEAELVGIAADEAARLRQRVRPVADPGADRDRVGLVALMSRLAA